MGAPPKIISGARAKVGFTDANGTQYVGIYSNWSYAVVYDIAPSFILGRYSAASLDYTAVEPVTCSGTGYRVFNHGAHVDGRVPRLKDLLTFTNLTVSVFDRVNPGTPFAQINEVKPGGYNTALTARQLEEMTMPYTGLLVDDESGTNAEPADSLDLPN